ncbi:MAG: hypothetical protein ACTHLA_05240 [Asticcacaulis sp.]|uniref:hypothetical protein n=1 Tax=Asticcacaulis sp. TaxID=1872648 RepID=UPI003F7B8C50
MKIWPAETFEFEIPRPLPDVAKSLRDFLKGGRGYETLTYAPMSGEVDDAGFVVLSRQDRSSRSPDFFFYGVFEPRDEATHVRVTLKSPAFLWWLGGAALVVLVGLAYAALKVNLLEPPIRDLLGLPVGLLVIVYASYLISFWQAQTRKRDLVHIMTFYGTRINLQSID